MTLNKVKTKIREMVPYLAIGAAIGIVLTQRQLRSDVDNLTDAVDSLIQTNDILIDQM